MIIVMGSNRVAYVNDVTSYRAAKNKLTTQALMLYVGASANILGLARQTVADHGESSAPQQLSWYKYGRSNSALLVPDCACKLGASLQSYVRTASQLSLSPV